MSGWVAMDSRSVPPIPPKPTAAWRSLARPVRADGTRGVSASAEAPARKSRREMEFFIDSSLANIDTSNGRGFSLVDGFSSREDRHPRGQLDPRSAGLRHFQGPHPAVGNGAIETLVQAPAPQACEERSEPAPVRDHADASLRMPAKEPLEPAEGPDLDSLEALAARKDERGVGPKPRILPADLRFRMPGRMAVVHLAQHHRMADRLLPSPEPDQDLGRLPRPELIAAVEMRDLLPRQEPRRPFGVFSAFGKQPLDALAPPPVPH